MNPGYAGRSELPDNLKALFRPVVMVVPDLNMICEIMLMSEGFEDARKLAKKMVVLYKLSKEQLSKQYHYDFGLRALKSVLVMAGGLKRDAPDYSEDLVLMRALRDMNMPKFIFEDVPLFRGLIQDLFPGQNVPRVGHEDLKERVVINFTKDGYKLVDVQVDKCIQLHETMLTRHTTMVVGPTGAGKTTIIEYLQKSMAVNTLTFIINPKAQTVDELYGVLNPDTREWKEGLLSKIFRSCNEFPTKEENRWILFDGDVDAVWVENMNSVMDDNKILTLFNGERIRLENFCKMLFEVYDLQYASPATISRCGMVYVDPKDLKFTPYFEKWMKKWEKKREEERKIIEEKKDEVEMEPHWETFCDSVREFFDKYIPPCIKYIFDGENEDKQEAPLSFLVPRSDLNMVEQMLRLMDSMLPETDQEIPPEYDVLEHMFIFAMIWSLAVPLTEPSQKRLTDFIRKTTSRSLPPTSLFDSFYDYQSQKIWTPWDKKFLEEYVPPEDGKFSKILVPTTDTKKFNWLFEQISGRRQFPCLFVGHSGTAKSVILQNYINQLDPEKHVKLNINFSSRTTSMDVQRNIEDNIDKRSGKNFGPPVGKKLIIFVDDMHMPKIDTYGTQQPIALLKFLVDKGFIYDRESTLDPKFVKDTQFLAAMLPPGGGTNSVDPRFLTLFSVFCIHFPSDDTIDTIYSSILKGHLKDFNEEIQGMTSKLTKATLRLYRLVEESLPRTPMKFHYIFNLRDLSRIYEGLFRSRLNIFKDKESFMRLWRNEAAHVFSDRLISQEDRDFVETKAISNVIKEVFPDLHEPTMVDPLIFGDYMKANPAEPEFEDP
jgi:dynein heavy chain